MAAAQRRRTLSKYEKLLSGQGDQQGCGRKIRRGRPGSSTQVLTHHVWCRRKWLCPVCGYTAASLEGRRLERRLRRWIGLGGGLAVLTLTVAHNPIDPLAVLWCHLDQGWATMQRGRTWRTAGQSFGFAGFVRVTEVVHNPRTGWNVHSHVLLFLDRESDQTDLEGLQHVLARRFTQGVIDSGGQAAVEQQKLWPINPGSESQPAHYYTKAPTEYRSRGGSRSPMAILGGLYDTGHGHELWQEFKATISDRPRRRQIVYSRNIDRLTPSGRTLGE